MSPKRQQPGAESARFGERLERIVRSLGLSVAELSARTAEDPAREIPAELIRRTMNGDRRATVDDLVTLADTLDVSIETLLGRDNRPAELDVAKSVVRDWVEALHQFEAEQQREAQAQLQHDQARRALERATENRVAAAVTAEAIEGEIRTYASEWTQVEREEFLRGQIRTLSRPIEFHGLCDLMGVVPSATPLWLSPEGTK